MEAELLPRESGKNLPILSLLKIPYHNLVMLTQGRVKREKGDKLFLPLLIHREFSPNRFSMVLTLSPSQLPRLTHETHHHSDGQCLRFILNGMESLSSSTEQADKLLESKHGPQVCM